MSNKYKILVADDDATFVELLSERLKHEGYDTVAAFEGVMVIETALSEKPDLILLDIKMPYGKGDTVLRSLQYAYETKDIPVIIVTGFRDDEIKANAMEGGAKAYFEKPIDNTKLFTKIKELLPKK